MSIVKTTLVNERLISLDVLRGITIAFMIIVNTPGSWEHVYPMLLHAKWNGCTPTDLVFPFFTTIVGLSMAVSSRKSENKKMEFQNIAKRAALIFGIGLLLNYFPFFNKSLDQLRIMGVLQRIAMAYFLAGTVLVFTPKKWQPAWIFIFGIGYYLLLRFGAVFPPTLEDNLPNKLDLWLFSANHVYKGYGIPFDPEGLMGTLGTAVNVLLGYEVGKQIKNVDFKWGRTGYAFITGLGIMTIGKILSLHLPLNKPLWTPTYSLFTTGLCFILFGALIWVIDVKKQTKPFEFFKIYGMNALASYALSVLIIKTAGLIKIGDKGLYSFLYDGLFQPWLGDKSGSFIQACFFTFIVWIFAYVLYRKRIFLRV